MSKFAEMLMRQVERSKKHWIPHKYQEEACKWLLSRDSSALFLDPGLGKTAITLACVLTLKMAGKSPKVLVVAPLRVAYSVWATESKIWEDFKGLSVVVLHGADREKMLKEKHDIYVVNYEGIDWLLGMRGQRRDRPRILSIKNFRKHGFDTLVFDELSKMKATNTVRYRMMASVLPTFKRRWGLTGSPASNSLTDLFGQCYCLDLGATFGGVAGFYLNAYFTKEGRSGRWTIKDSSMAEKIYQKVSTLALRMSAKDYLELPEVLEVTRELELPQTARKTYKEMEDKMFVDLGKDIVTAATVESASVKCRQIASGSVYATEKDNPISVLFPDQALKRKAVHIHNAKLDALEDLIDELQGQPLLVGYFFVFEMEAIRKRFGDKIPYIGGGSKQQEVAEIERRWNNNEIPILLANPSSAGHGLNLQKGGARNLLWYTLPWSFELYKQFIGRILRQGNDSSSVTVHTFIVKDTVEEVVRRVLLQKEKGEVALLDALMEYRKYKGVR